MSSQPQIGLLRRSMQLRSSFARAIEARSSRAAVLEVQRDYLRARLLAAHVWELDELAGRKLRAISDRDRSAVPPTDAPARPVAEHSAEDLGMAELARDRDAVPPVLNVPGSVRPNNDRDR